MEHPLKHMPQPRQFTVVRDDLAERLDEIAELAAIWAKSRAKGSNPVILRRALLAAIEETHMAAKAAEAACAPH